MRTRFCCNLLGLAGLSLLSTVGAFAITVAPTSYDTLNGNTGSYNYWDDTYNGSGNSMLDNDPLTGGVGDLTDGVIATDNWFVTEAPAGPGPYVGWTLDPTITFHFASSESFTNSRIYFDDADGAGGVSAPQGVIINGSLFPVSDPVGSAPFFVDFDLTSIAATDTLSIQLLRNNSWVFASEFQFSAAGNNVPEPGAATMLIGAGLTGIGMLLRRRRK